MNYLRRLRRKAIFWWLSSFPFVTRKRMERELDAWHRTHDAERKALKEARAFLELEIARLSRVKVDRWNDTHIISITVSVTQALIRKPRTRELVWESVIKEIIWGVEREAGVGR